MLYSHMKTIILALLVLLPAVVFAQPAIQFQSETHDFGEVKQGVPLEHIFEVVNSGTEDLVISQLLSS